MTPSIMACVTDLEARTLLQRAQGMLQKWPEGFVGFLAAIRCREGDGDVAGGVRVFTGGRVELSLPHSALSAWAKSALGAISLACTPRFFKDGDGRFPITLEPEDRHLLGRRVQVPLGDGTYRAYSIDPKGRIRQQENVEPTRRATVTYDGFVRTCPGRTLPTRIRILEWDVTSEAALEAADIEDSYACRAHVWLPVCRRTTVTHGPMRRELCLELSRHVLL